MLAAQALLLAGDDASCADLLPGIADGSTVAALVWDGWSASAASVTAAQGDGWTLNGTGRFVLDGDTADVLLVVAATPDGVGLFRVDPDDARCRQEVGMDLTIRYATVELRASRNSESMLMSSHSPLRRTSVRSRSSTLKACRS